MNGKIVITVNAEAETVVTLRHPNGEAFPLPGVLMREGVVYEIDVSGEDLAIGPFVAYDREAHDA